MSKAEGKVYTSTDDALYIQHILAGHSSIAKYCIAIISAIVVFFPSTYSFIHPPFVYEWILVFSVVFGIFGFILAAISLHTSEYSDDTNEIRKAYHSRRESVRAAVATGAFLLSVSSYVVSNAVSDYRSPPSIATIGLNPMPPVAGETVAFLGRADDQNGDRMAWQWRLTERGEGPRRARTLQSSLETAYWQALPGKWLVTASVIDSAGHRSAEQSIPFSVAERRER